MKKLLLSIVCLAFLTGCGHQQEKKELAEFAEQQKSNLNALWGGNGLMGATCIFDGKNLVYEISFDNSSFYVVENPEFIDSQKNIVEMLLKSGYSNMSGNLKAVGGKVIYHYINKSTGKIITMECEP